VAGGDQGLEAGGYLAVGVERVLQAAHGPRLGGQVGFGHARVGGPDVALAGAGIGAGEDGDGSDTREGAHGLHTDASQEGRVGGPFAAVDLLVINLHEDGFGQVATAGKRVAAQGAQHVHTGADFVQHGESQGAVLGCGSVGVVPVLFHEGNDTIGGVGEL